MRRGPIKAITLIAGLAAATMLAGPASASSSLKPALSSVEPGPGPGGCSVDIVNREPGGSYANGRIEFTYVLAGPTCRSGVYGLIVTNTFNRHQVAAYATLGTGRSSQVTFDEPLPFTPTGDGTTSGGVPGSGLCVIGFTLRQARIADIAPDQKPDLASALADPQCSPLLLTGPPTGGARAFH